jgi:cellulose synthase/poly-beta-1,6-N-acetylglucosamine synthase-like glycosyltransferase
MIYETIFWFLVIVVTYTYVGYPIILLFFKRFSISIDEKYEPTVTLMIVAHNEQDNITEKLQNSIELDYPDKKLQILLIDDGSTDGTVEAGMQFDSVDVIKLPHKGKTNSQNIGIEKASGEIVVFSDANSIYDRKTIRSLVSKFSDRNVGCVCGELKYKNRGRRKYSRKDNRSQEGLYWSYEIILKRLEGRSGRLLGANGSIYAIRKDLYVPLSEDSISDFLEPIIIHSNGYQVIYDPEAVAIEEEPQFTFQRKRRIILRSLGSLKHVYKFMNPIKKGNIFLTLISHKVLRWFMPLFFILIFASNLFILDNKVIYVWLFGGQLLFYLSGLFIKSVKYFIIVNFAALLSIFDWIRGKQITKWSVIR